METIKNIAILRTVQEAGFGTVERLLCGVGVAAEPL